MKRFWLATGLTIAVLSGSAVAWNYERKKDQRLFERRESLFYQRQRLDLLQGLSLTGMANRGVSYYCHRATVSYDNELQDVGRVIDEKNDLDLGMMTIQLFYDRASAEPRAAKIEMHLSPLAWKGETRLPKEIDSILQKAVQDKEAHGSAYGMDCFAYLEDGKAWLTLRSTWPLPYSGARTHSVSRQTQKLAAAHSWGAKFIAGAALNDAAILSYSPSSIGGSEVRGYVSFTGGESIAIPFKLTTDPTAKAAKWGEKAEPEIVNITLHGSRPLSPMLNAEITRLLSEWSGEAQPYGNVTTPASEISTREPYYDKGFSLRLTDDFKRKLTEYIDQRRNKSRHQSITASKSASQPASTQ